MTDDLTRLLASNAILMLADTETSKSIRVLHEAADTRAIRPKDVFDAMRQLEKQKLSVSTHGRCMLFSAIAVITDIRLPCFSCSQTAGQRTWLPPAGGGN